MLHVYNTLTRKKERFKPINGKTVGLYACGITAYYYAHIGNMRTYINEDVIRRVLIHDGYELKDVMNITDVGHLVGDGDIGEDKVTAEAKAEHKSAREIALFYTLIFMKDCTRLNLLPFQNKPLATEHIKDMIALIEELEQKGFVYKAENGVYFDTSKFKEYGKLSGMNFEELNDQQKAGARVERVSGLRNHTDFAVWRFSNKEQKEMVWDTKWGKGFPGWHIECSAMSMKYLGNHFDLHFGGIDHIPIHHTNEIAQSEAATGEKFVNYWMHMNFLTVDGMKMSKSLKNIYTIEDLVKKGHSPISVRYFMISGHYRQELNFTFDALKNAENTLKGIYSFVERLASTKNKTANKDSAEFKKKISGFKKEFFASLDDDINTPLALSNMFALINETNKRTDLNSMEAKAVLKVMLEFDEVLALNFKDYTKIEKASDAVKKLIDAREDARKKKDFKKADEIRRELLMKHNIVLEDTADGVKWHIN